MRKIAFSVLLAFVWSVAAAQECKTQTIITSDGRVVVCTVCGAFISCV